MCLGLYRRMYPDTPHSNPNRYVITNPSASLRLIPSDMVGYTQHSSPLVTCVGLANLVLHTICVAMVTEFVYCT